MALKVEIRDNERVGEYLDNLPEDSFDVAKEIFIDAVFRAHRRVGRNLKRRLTVRTGMLRRSIRTDVGGTDLDSLRASIYSAGKVAGREVVYAPIHEFGGTVRAKRAYKGIPGGPYLNIPTDANKTPAGVMRYTAKTIFKDYGGRVVKFKSGKYGVIVTDGKSTIPRVMFTLHKRVHIPPRLGMREAANKQVPTILSRLKRELGEKGIV